MNTWRWAIALMRRQAHAKLQILICIFAFLLAGSCGRAADVLFNFGDYTSTPQQLKRFTLYPVQVSLTNNSQLITRDRIVAATGTNGSMTVSNVMGGGYRSELAGTSIVTTNFFFFPTTNGLLNAKDYLANLTNGNSLSTYVQQITSLNGSVVVSPGTGIGVVDLAVSLSGISGVTNVALSMPPEFSVAGSPITAGGTLAVSRVSQAQNLFLASPNGSSGVMSPRAIVAADLPASVTLQGNSFNGASQLLQLDSSTRLPAVNASQLTTLNAGNISSGTLSDARLNTDVTKQGNIFNGISQLVQLDGSGNLPVLNGSALTGLTAANLTGSHTLPAGVLPSDVPFLDQNNAWSAASSNNFAGQTLVQHSLISALDSSQLQPLSQATNFAVDFNVPVSSFKPTNNVFFLYSTNFAIGGSQDKLFKLQGSASNFTVKWGTDLTNFYGVYSTNGYILGNSNSPHVIAVHIDGAHGAEVIGIALPNN
jgi:hypothetical protein